MGKTRSCEPCQTQTVVRYPGGDYYCVVCGVYAAMEGDPVRMPHPNRREYPDPSSHRGLVFDALRKGAATAEGLAGIVGISMLQVRNALAGLREKGLVVGWFALTEKGLTDA